MKLSYDGFYFYLSCDVLDNPLAKRLGFAWDKSKGCWVTPYADIASKAARFGDDVVKSLIKKMQAAESKRRALSSTNASSFEVLVPEGLECRPYQKAGVEFIISNSKAVLLADEMGLGKTIQAIVACNMLRPKNVLVICPASAKNVWSYEWGRWSLLKHLSVGVVKGKKAYPNSDVVIVNYDVVESHGLKLKEKMWDMIIIDEAHKIKNPKTKRAKNIVGGRFKIKKDNGRYGYQVIAPIKAKYKIAITGTPIENKTIDFFPILHYLMPEGFPNWRDFGLRYCGAKKGFIGWEFKGSSNLDELQRKLRSTIMIRRLKRDVLTELPPKVRQIIEIDADTRTKKLLKTEELLLKEHGGDYNSLIKNLSSGAKVEFLAMAKMRLELAQFIFPYVVSHLESLIEAGEKVIVFGHHVAEMIVPLGAHFKDKSVSLYGSTSLRNRQLAVEKFQSDESIRLFIGNIDAASESITLTKASVVVFAEGAWTPGRLNQAEDRAHRMGHIGSLLVQHLVVKESIAATMIRYAVDKQNVSDKALNGDDKKFLKDMLA